MTKCHICICKGAGKERKQAKSVKVLNGIFEIIFRGADLTPKILEGCLVCICKLNYFL